MHGTIKKWFSLVFLVILFAFPFSASAQEPVTFAALNVNFWPEFDQPNMLVIYEFVLAPDVSIPVDITLRIPADANLIAVAYQQDGGLLNAPFQEPIVDGDWQIVTLTVDTASVYRIEYYSPLTFNGDERQFNYLWPGDYPVDVMTFEVQIPPDTVEISSTPELTTERQANGLQYQAWSSDALNQGEQVPFTLTYTRTSDALTGDVQPMQAEPVDDNTAGRISLSNYLPYILGGVGFILIVAGGVYFWQSGKGKSKSQQRQRHRSIPADQDSDEQTYCHQCGKRAQPNDRFCRTCGTRLRRES